VLRTATKLVLSGAALCALVQVIIITIIIITIIIIIIIIIIDDMNVSCHRPLFSGTSLEPAVIPTAQASSFTLQYFPYYV